jgi:tail protein
MSFNNKRHYNNVNRNIEIKINDITEGNRYAKFTQLEKCLTGGVPEYVPTDNTAPLPSVNIRMKDCSNERIEKALRTMAMSFDIPLKSAKGEVFLYKAQEDLTDKWCVFFSELVRNTYDFITDYCDLPQKTVMSKSVLTHKGKILYYPETGEPIKQADWDKFVKNLEKFLNRNIKDTEKKIILQSNSLGKILDRMLKYNTLEAVKELQLEKLQYHGKTFDWISESVKNMKNTFGDFFTRGEQARIEMLTQSAAIKVTNITDKMCGDIKQILIDGVKGHKSKSEVSQALFDKMVGDNRDYQRLADTEIQNAVNNSFLREEVQNTPDGKKTYFQRIEVIDKNTCAFCKRMNGKIAVWSDKPLKDEKAHDGIADFVIWEGKEWNGSTHSFTTGVFHPYCRGTWVRYDTDIDNARIDALVAEQSGRAKKWNAAVKQAKEEYKKNGIVNPDDTTQGFTERINELFRSEDTIDKSLTYSGYPLQGRTTFAGLKISIENRKGSIRRGVDSDGHKWAIKMKYDYGYIRETEGVDGDHVDCYLGDNENARNVYIIHQKIPGTDIYDEDKCMLGFNTLEEAKRAYFSQYDKSGFFGGVDTVPIEVFKEKVRLKKWHGKKLEHLQDC